LEKQLRGRIGLPARRIETDCADLFEVRAERRESRAPGQSRLLAEAEELAEVEKE
jgi:hypothetical protein